MPRGMLRPLTGFDTEFRPEFAIDGELVWYSTT
jgi:hypothetical protein